ncbi:MAG TPA: hypothetical protein VHU61_08990 [Solirubrobacteraceae bacterium]|jgi:hypothetical protein|nr:hypothetical protein [Solirubrobacteraceae bacterium]
MVDPRIYRGFVILVAFAVIVFGFSLTDQPRRLGTSVAPGQYFASVASTTKTLARDYPDRAPGSSGDLALAGYVGRKLSQAGAFGVRTQLFSAHTTTGEQQLENVIATRPGLGSGTIVVVSDRDGSAATATADLSGTAVLIDLARALSGESLGRSVSLISTSGSIGVAGATALAHSLAGKQVDAVIVLGDLASATVHSPVVVPWSSTDLLSPPLLSRTLTAYVGAETGIASGSGGLAGQVARLAFPFATTEQAPFAAQGIPAVLLSLSGDRPISGHPATGPAARTVSLGDAVLQTVSSLDHGQAVGAPSAYLVISGQRVPLWAVQLLVLALILPVAASTLDAVARTRRRGHTLMRWLGWVLAGAVPFVIGLVALLIARATGLLSFTPPGAAAGVGVKMTGGDLAVLLVIAALVVAGFALLRPLCLRLLARQLPESGRRPESPAADAAAVALSVVLCLLAIVLWVLDPFAALLLVPAMHMWLWLAQPGARAHRWSMALLLLIGVVPLALVLFYYANAYGLSPLALAWSLALLPGGAMSIVIALCWALALGCVASAVIIGLRAVRAAAAVADQLVTVRGPASYAGPGSLGGTKSALRR